MSNTQILLVVATSTVGLAVHYLIVRQTAEPVLRFFTEGTNAGNVIGLMGTLAVAPGALALWLLHFYTGSYASWFVGVLVIAAIASTFVALFRAQGSID